jgi:hypothetical protein
MMISGINARGRKGIEIEHSYNHHQYRLDESHRDILGRRTEFSEVDRVCIQISAALVYEYLIFTVT